jgi:hypothetical protein
MQTSPVGGLPPASTRETRAQDALVAFFSQSRASSRILHLLSTKTKPIGYKALVDEIRFAGKSSPHYRDLPAGAVRSILWITQLAGLVSLTRHGFAITEVGREVQRRVELGPESTTQAPGTPRRSALARLRSFTSWISRVPQSANLRNFKPRPKRNHQMLLVTEATRTFTALEFLFAALQAVAFVFVLLWVKLTRYRRRMKEEKTRAIRLRARRAPHERSERWRRRRVGLVPRTPALHFDTRHQPLRERDSEFRPSLGADRLVHH